MTMKGNDFRRYYKPPQIAHEGAQYLLSTYGIEHALYMAFAAGRHGEVDYQSWLDNTKESVYSARTKSAGRRGARANRKKEGKKT